MALVSHHRLVEWQFLSNSAFSACLACSLYLHVLNSCPAVSVFRNSFNLFLDLTIIISNTIFYIYFSAHIHGI